MTDVKLISYSKSADGLDLGNCQELVAYCARVSNPSNQMNTETSDRLINYLIRHKHWSPLEMVNVCMEIHTTRDIAHQIVRHRSFAFQEFSQRYANPKEMGDMFVYFSHTCSSCVFGYCLLGCFSNVCAHPKLWIFKKHYKSIVKNAILEEPPLRNTCWKMYFLGWNRALFFCLFGNY